MLQAANIDLFNPLVSKPQKSECQNMYTNYKLSQWRSVKVNS